MSQTTFNRRTTTYAIIILLFYSCAGKPVINSFTVTPVTITANDTVRINWEVKGKPTLLIHQPELPDSAEKYLNLSLVVEKGGKEINRPAQVTILPANSTTRITFETELQGDTLIAAGEKNSDK